MPLIRFSKFLSTSNFLKDFFFNQEAILDFSETFSEMTKMIIWYFFFDLLIYGLYL